MTYLIGDVGGTNLRLALVDQSGRLFALRVMSCQDHMSLVDACRFFLGTTPCAEGPAEGYLAVASPVFDDFVQMTSMNWPSFSIEDTRQQLGLKKLEVLNDLLATLFAIPYLTEGDTQKVGEGEAVAHEPVWALGCGTGVGAAALCWTGTDWLPLASEVGHATIAATTEQQEKLLAVLRNTHGDVWAEHVLSARGLVNLYMAAAEVDGLTPDPRVSPADIRRLGTTSGRDPCSIALRAFVGFLGTLAANLTLTLNARGGVYLTGGIMSPVMPWFDPSSFRSHFVGRGRMAEYLATVPTYIITLEHPALLGLARRALTNR